MEDWYSRPAGHILKELETGPEGLSGREAAGGWSGRGPMSWRPPGGRGCWPGCWGSCGTP